VFHISIGELELCLGGLIPPMTPRGDGTDQVTVFGSKVRSISAELNHNRSPWVLVSDKGVCCHHSSS